MTSKIEPKRLMAVIFKPRFLNMGLLYEGGIIIFDIF